MASTTMKPCPACGSDVVKMEQMDSNHWIGWCIDCDFASPIHWSKVAARRIWNTRAPEPAAPRPARDGEGRGG